MNNDATEEININMKYYKFPITRKKVIKYQIKWKNQYAKLKLKICK